LQYPTCILDDKEAADDRVMTWDGGEVDPFEIHYHENDVVSGPVEGGD